MLKINYNNIYLTRGDTAVIDLELEDYGVQETDIVILTVKKNVNTDEIELQKELDKEKMQFVIDHNDTKDLAYGDYVYDVQLSTSDGQVFTVIEPHAFKLKTEVTW